MGKYLPELTVANAVIESNTGIAPGFVEKKTGICSRRVATDHETTSHMSAAASRQALSRSLLSGADIQRVVSCSFTGDYLFPALAAKVHQLLGMTDACLVYDILANCTSFTVALDTVIPAMREDPSERHSLIVGSSRMSRLVNPKDPNTAFYFGDGAAAVVLGDVPDGFGYLCSAHQTNSRVYDSVRLRGGGTNIPWSALTAAPEAQYTEVNGLEVWKQVVQYQPSVIRAALAKIGKTTDDVDFFIFHQANLRLIEYLMAKMKQPMTKTFTNVQCLGNTADASMLLALCEAAEHRCLERGMLVVVSGVGAGFIFGATVMRWY